MVLLSTNLTNQLLFDIRGVYEAGTSKKMI